MSDTDTGPQFEAQEDEPTAPEATATPLLCPADGVPELSASAEQIADAAERL